MKNLFRIIFFIPRLIISIIWNFFWAIFRTIVIIGIVCFGLLYYANNSSSQLANTISTIANNVTSYFSANSDDIANSLKDLSTDDFTYYSGARWSSNSANVYIETTNETLIEAYEEAINGMPQEFLLLIWFLMNHRRTLLRLIILMLARKQQALQRQRQML